MKATFLLAACMIITVGMTNSPTIKGAWINVSSGVTTIRIYTDSFFSVAVYKANEFVATFGGRYTEQGTVLTETIEFDSQNPARVGTDQKNEFSWRAQEEEISIGPKDSRKTFTRLDVDSPGKLAGAWLITGRYNNNTLNKMTPGARRTMKILSGTRFQWIAYNVETKEFFGTGGGQYTTENGQYTEKIEFFSRDQSRVGISLSFNFVLMDDGGWRHSGKSSKGDPIDEIWTQREKLGI